MKTTGRALALAVTAAILLGGCTGDEEPDGGNGGTAGTGTGPTGPTDGGPTPVQTGPGDAGRYEYENAGLRVVLDIDGNTGSMEVDNGTDRELPEPDFYILDARTGDEFEGEVAAPEPIPAGETATFEISFAGIEVGEIGAIALLFGQDNYGLFVRTA